VTSTGGATDSLADIAAYYYNTDLRNASLSNCTGSLGTNVCADNVSPITGNAAHSFGDSAIWQHMTTFTLGLGVSGLLRYTPDYLTASSGDFFEITNGNKPWPVPGPNQGPENVDDLWHAAVNGRGQYFSAGNPNSLATSLSTALNSLSAITGAAAAASTSSLQPVEGDNDIFVAKFRSVEWTGDLQAFKILSNASITSTPTWTAQAQLALQTPASRTIYYRSGTPGTLKPFTYLNLTADAINSTFDNFCSKAGAGGAAAPAQCGGLDATTLGQANSGANLVAYLRGDQTLAYYRTRAAVLGDIINASPLFVGKPNFRYLDSSYNDFKTAQAGRTAVVLAAANDGMLHAFDRITGAERWAYIPSFVMGNLYKLADTSYRDNHSYFVDGSPQMGDIFDGQNWRTIVVGGLGGGGRGYYALDVTDPTTPSLLWEFSDPQLGLSFGNPIITKRANATGDWVVVFASGYNNNVSGGDGNGHLFVLNALTGQKVKNAANATLDVATLTSGSTPAGTSGTPSGLAKLNAWIDSENDNTARRFYGGDLLGNLWRFDIDSQVAPHEAALLLGTMKLADGTPQPITVKPALAEVEFPTASGTKFPVVFVGTGEYLGVSDLANTTQQSIYAVKDPMLDASWGTLRTNSLLLTRTLTIGTGGVRTIDSSPVDWGSRVGWRVDFPGSGERVNVNPQLVLNTLTVGTNVPSSDACTIGGSSFLYKFDITTGSTAAGESTVGTFLGSVLVEGLTTVQLGSTANSPGSIVTIVTRSDATLQTSSSSPTGSGGSLRRSSWRELVD
jgi:type IV pilus assembly protein PilY1